MKKIQIITVVFLLLAITSLPSTVFAENIAGAATIDEGDFWHTEIPIVDTSEVYYTIIVETGGPVDILLFDEENFDLFINQEPFDFITEGSQVNTSAVDITVLLEPGTYFLVVDNSNASVASPPENNINNVTRITFNIDYPVLQDMICFFAGVGVVIVVIILVVFIIVKKVGQTKQYRQPYSQHNIYQQPIQLIPPMRSCHSCERQIPIDSVVCPYCEIKQEGI
jgi:hypothetical protein